jgi:hypothetical protein
VPAVCTGHPATTGAGEAGVVRRVLACTPTAGTDAVSAARRWCVDRAMRTETVTDVLRLVEEAVAYASRFGPRGLVMTMRWVDLDRMRIELAWQGCAAQALASASSSGECLQRASRVCDALAETWGLGTDEDGNSWQRFTVDTRRRSGSAARMTTQAGGRPGKPGCRARAATDWRAHITASRVAAFGRTRPSARRRAAAR